MLWIALADDAHHALALDHLAVLTDWFDAAANFHEDSDVRAKLPARRGEGISELAFEITGSSSRNQAEPALKEPAAEQTVKTPPFTWRPESSAEQKDSEAERRNARSSISGWFGRSGDAPRTVW